MSTQILIDTRGGFTLIELVVTMALLAAIAAVGTLEVRRVKPADPNDPQTMLADSLRAATASGRTIALGLTIHGGFAQATIRPDGSVVADSAFGVDLLTGRPDHAK